MAQPTWLAIGYESERAIALEHALALVNDAFDDVPEQIASLTRGQAIPAQWRRFLDRLAAELAIARDQRFALTRLQSQAKRQMLPPGMYVRPT